ncbi:MAG: phytoene/squalene synthase family protein [Pseudomonadota bacterium]|nr:phytoene/squalene synthase family protein [Pseudomonadota bacterium]
MSQDIDAHIAFQNGILPRVSRTFALTIPCLPEPLAQVVANAYLLCRIADTIEDDPALHAHEKAMFGAWLTATVAQTRPTDGFGQELASRLAPQTPAAERLLVAETDRVVSVTASFTATQIAAIERAVGVMTTGMADFQHNDSGQGVADLATLNRYCYHVAGVVGELLTTLFCEHAGTIAARRSDLQPLAVSFGQGLQMTNILKDVWDDRERGACWLPRDVFLRHGVDLRRADQVVPGRHFSSGVQELAAITRQHLHSALLYARTIPRQEPGIRTFCLWPVGMALLTLRKISRHPEFRSAEQVKISRRSVRLSRLVTNLAARSNLMLGFLFGSMERAVSLVPGRSSLLRGGDTG